MSVSRDELVLMKFAASGDRRELLSLMTAAGARITDASPRFVTFKMIDTPEKIETLLQSVQKYELLELLRS
ncbi:hypothetical protein [Candidatus Soleaferrea massiliensis]|uniref:hypothetical protein n=1 Tax=Candidatus Soleaferrea massiliensis TaxID=1470354 RepID=UPI00058CB7B7|nr:hypothetical protein [Candidatus Soleaferrea massiliensis]